LARNRTLSKNLQIIASIGHKKKPKIMILLSLSNRRRISSRLINIHQIRDQSLCFDFRQ
jgi:hypothetical protein